MSPSRLNPIRPNLRSPKGRKQWVFASAGLVLACAFSIFLSGCLLRHKVQAASPVTSAPAPRPVPEEASPPPATAPPAVKEPAEQVPLPAGQEAMKEPPKPATPPRKQTAENTEPEPVKPAPPQISLQLSPAAQAELEQKTNDNIAVAEKNIQQASGHSLNSSQQDILEKVRAFLAQSVEAMKAADWSRAEDLSHKAYVLSIDLINSL